MGRQEGIRCCIQRFSEGRGEGGGEGGEGWGGEGGGAWTGLKGMGLKETVIGHETMRR